ncbi:MAG: magnesium and cobalt transport protein CorA [Candidatus Dadabacteria bacterium]|nr:MAG: magnesium and cobalt transport protein CorA [Candidatus Dadabacteria bacterium]
MTIQLHSYHPQTGLVTHEDITSLDALTRQKDQTLWLDIETRDQKKLEQIAGYFNLHELAIEDCFTPGHFPKMEEYPDHTFIILRTLKSWSEVEDVWEEEDEENLPEDARRDLFTRKIAIFISRNFIITFRRKEISWLDALFRQVRQYPEDTIARGTDVLLHRIVDVLIDRFLRGINYFENLLDEMEDVVIERTDEFEVQEIVELKRELVYLRRIMRDQRAVIARLASEASVVKERERRRHFKDIDDHALTIIHTLDKQIENCNGVRDAYYAMVNVRLGDIMRILAILTTILAPLNLLVGFYGMNFEALPLLHSQYGFWFIVVIMVLLSVLMIAYFRKKRWL